jgi:hypothetical protein
MLSMPYPFFDGVYPQKSWFIQIQI